MCICAAGASAMLGVYEGDIWFSAFYVLYTHFRVMSNFSIAVHSLMFIPTIEVSHHIVEEGEEGEMVR